MVCGAAGPVSTARERKKPPADGKGFLVAERVGFEPTDPFEGVTSLAVKPLRPDSGTSPSARLSLELSRSHRESAQVVAVSWVGGYTSPSGPRSPAHGGAHVYGFVHGPRAQNTQRSLAASAQLAMLAFTLSTFHPRRPN